MPVSPAKVAPAPVGRIPELGEDVHELTGFGATADCLFLTPAGGFAPRWDAGMSGVVQTILVASDHADVAPRSRGGHQRAGREGARR